MDKSFLFVIAIHFAVPEASELPLCARLSELYDTSPGLDCQVSTNSTHSAIATCHPLSGEAVSVTAAGDIERWNKPGGGSGIVFDSWRFSTGEVQD